HRRELKIVPAVHGTANRIDEVAGVVDLFQRAYERPVIDVALAKWTELPIPVLDPAFGIVELEVGRQCPQVFEMRVHEQRTAVADGAVHRLIGPPQAMRIDAGLERG